MAYVIVQSLKNWLLITAIFIICQAFGAVHKVRHAIFGQFLHPLPSVTLRHTPRDPPESTSHILDHTRFLLGLVQKTLTKVPCTNSLSIVCGDFCLEFCLLSGRFCPRGAFCPFPLLSECMCYNRKLNVTWNFMFHMYDKNLYKSDVTCSWPLPLSQTVTPSRTPFPLERDVLYGRPLTAIFIICKAFG